MTATQQYARLRRLVDTDTRANLFLAAQGPDGVEIQQVDIGGDLGQHFLQAARTMLQSRQEELQAVHFQPGEKAGDGRICYLEPQEVPGVDETMARVSNTANHPWFEGDRDFKRRLKFYVLQVRHGNEEALFFRQMNAKAEIRKKGILVRLAGHRFNEVDEQLFLFDERFDFVVHEGYTFLFTYGPFTNLFKEDMRVAFAERAQPALQSLAERVSMPNFDEFVEACQTDHRLSAALVRVADRGALERLTMEWLLEKNAALTTHQLTVVNGEDGAPAIVFEPGPATRFILTKILEEKVNRGELTGTTWVAGNHVPG